jgi:hypothetical protein
VIDLDIHRKDPAVEKSSLLYMCRAHPRKPQVEKSQIHATSVGTHQQPSSHLRLNQHELTASMNNSWSKQATSSSSHSRLNQLDCQQQFMILTSNSAGFW